MIDAHPNHNPDPKIDLTVPYEIVRLLDNGKCLVNAVTKVIKCPDCEEEIRYGGSWNVSGLGLFTED